MGVFVIYKLKGILVVLIDCFDFFIFFLVMNLLFDIVDFYLKELNIFNNLVNVNYVIFLVEFDIGRCICDF